MHRPYTYFVCARCRDCFHLVNTHMAWHGTATGHKKVETSPSKLLRIHRLIVIFNFHSAFSSTSSTLMLFPLLSSCLSFFAYLNVTDIVQHEFSLFNHLLNHVVWAVRWQGHQTIANAMPWNKWLYKCKGMTHVIYNRKRKTKTDGMQMRCT